MEVTVIHVEHVPAGYLLSLSAGGSHRQAAVAVGKRFKFSKSSAASALAQGGTGLQMDVLAVEGSAQVNASEFPEELQQGPTDAEGNSSGAAAASEESCAAAAVSQQQGSSNKTRPKGACSYIDVPVPAASGDGDVSPLDRMRIVLEIKCMLNDKVSTTRAVLKGPNASEDPLDIDEMVASPEAAPPTTEPQAAAAEANQSLATSMSPPSGDAASYLQEHNIMPFVESMVRILANHRPQDPWNEISAMLPEDASHKAGD